MNAMCGIDRWGGLSALLSFALRSWGVAPGWDRVGLWPKAMLPTFAMQQAIVAEIEAEQALVAANRELITRFERKIQATLTRIWGEEPSCPAGEPA